MTPIAAYYVMVATDHDRNSHRSEFRAAAPRRSLAERIGAALETLVRLGRPAVTQPI